MVANQRPCRGRSTVTPEQCLIAQVDDRFAVAPGDVAVRQLMPLPKFGLRSDTKPTTRDDPDHSRLTLGTISQVRRESGQR